VDADVGVWRAVRFPGAGGSPWAPSLHVGVERGDWRGDVFAAAFAPQGRGAKASSIAGGHTHSAPDCSALRGGILCFAGNTRVMGGSLRWQSHDWPLTLQGAGWLRHDDGTLRSVNGEARHAARYGGGWLQAQWEVVPGWELAARSERIRAQAWLDGPGATLLAQEAGLIGSTPLRRDTAALAWQPRANLTLSAEIGRETQGSERVNFTVLRLRWHGQLDWPAGPSP
jgi:hypothetical protein